ncbi:Tetratricopeptide-like helical [Cynara cardunculus var. scolymus]|uniref:Tetratricopeptide-like helical n=1 Tax=Cynara cardunculus var. scolymus TaxID=59895 RepID=A0A103Y2M8_CYNCS|nr:Tetratricopeptide-like helical [Cynara cardunculus var. scolymus]
MVVIEPVPSTDIEPESSNSTTARVDSSNNNRANVDGVDSRNGDKATAAGYASDGYETASETKVGDDETVSDKNDTRNAVGNYQKHKLEEISVVSKDQTYEDALNEDELKQCNDCLAVSGFNLVKAYSPTYLGSSYAQNVEVVIICFLLNSLEDLLKNLSLEFTVFLLVDYCSPKILAQMNEAKVEGNKLFGDGLYQEALLKYDYAIQLAPEMSSSSEIRSICHNNRATCFCKLSPMEAEHGVRWRVYGGCDGEEEGGNYEDTIKECTKALEINPTYMKALLRRGEAHEKLKNYDEAIADMKKILELDPSNHQAKRTIIRLEPLAIEKREKMKEEMIGKLKDMGNTILGKFGMSVDNFKAVQDPNTGSYSISFQR